MATREVRRAFTVAIARQAREWLVREGRAEVVDAIDAALTSIDDESEGCGIEARHRRTLEAWASEGGAAFEVGCELLAMLARCAARGMGADRRTRTATAFGWRADPPTAAEVRERSWWWSRPADGGVPYALQLDVDLGSGLIFDAGEVSSGSCPSPFDPADWEGKWAPCMTPDDVAGLVSRVVGDEESDMRDEYDFSKAERGKFYRPFYRPRSPREPQPAAGSTRDGSTASPRRHVRVGSVFVEEIGSGGDLRVGLVRDSIVHGDEVIVRRGDRLVIDGEMRADAPQGGMRAEAWNRTERDWTEVAKLAGSLSRIGEAGIVDVAELASGIAHHLGLGISTLKDLWRPGSLTTDASARVARAGEAIGALANDAWFLPPEAVDQKRTAVLKVCAQLDLIVEAVRGIGSDRIAEADPFVVVGDARSSVISSMTAEIGTLKARVVDLESDLKQMIAVRAKVVSIGDRVSRLAALLGADQEQDVDAGLATIEAAVATLQKNEKVVGEMRHYVDDLIYCAFKYDDKPHQLYLSISRMAKHWCEDPQAKIEVRRLMDVAYLSANERNLSTSAERERDDLKAQLAAVDSALSVEDDPLSRIEAIGRLEYYWMLGALRAMGWVDERDAIGAGAIGDAFDRHRDLLGALQRMLPRRASSGWREAWRGIALESIAWFLRGAAGGGRLEGADRDRAERAADAVMEVVQAWEGAGSGSGRTARMTRVVIASLAQDEMLLQLLPEDVLPRVRVIALLQEAAGLDAAVEDDAASEVGRGPSPVVESPSASAPATAREATASRRLELESIARYLRMMAGRPSAGHELFGSAARASASVYAAIEASRAGRELDRDAWREIDSLATNEELLRLIPNDVVPAARVVALLAEVLDERSRYSFIFLRQEAARGRCLCEAIDAYDGAGELSEAARAELARIAGSFDEEHGLGEYGVASLLAAVDAGSIASVDRRMADLESAASAATLQRHGLTNEGS